MARLPVPGSDDGTWGDILNDFLRESHTSTGAIKTDAVGSAALANNSVGTSNLKDDSVSAAKVDDSVEITANKDTDTTLAANSDTKYPSQKAVKTYVDDSILSASIPDGDRGDITVSGSGSTWTIDDSVITNAKINDSAVTYIKLQDVSASNRILGRITSGAGTVEELTPANVRTMINVEDGADVTDAANVDAAGAVMNTDTSTAAMQFVVDEDNMVSDSATKVPTQQSTKAYADTKLAKSSNLSDLANAGTARTNLGLGNSATRDVGTTAGTVAAGDDSRVTGALQASSNLSDLANAGTARTNLGLGSAATASASTFAQVANNLSDLANAGTARTNLGLGDSATKNTGTTAGTVAAGDDSRITGAAQKSANLSDLANAGTARTNLGLGTAATLASDTDTTLAANSDSVIATQKATKAYADAIADTVPTAGVAGAILPGINPKIANFTAALDTALTAPGIDVVLIGDSIMQLQTAETKIAAMLYQHYNGQSAINTKLITPYVTAQGMAGTGANTSSAFKEGGVTFSSNGHNRSITVYCDGGIFLVTAGTGSFQVRDGGAGGTIKTTVDTSTLSGSNNMISVDFTTYASRSVYVEQVGAGSFIFEGFLPTYGNRTKGVRLWPASVPGDFSLEYTTSTFKGFDLISKISAAGPDPHIIVATGYNDPADPTSDYTALLTGIQARTTGDILCVAPWWNASSSEDLSQSNYFKAVAESKNAAFIDFGRLFGDISNTSDFYDLSGDGAHPSAQASDTMADAIMATISGNPIGFALTSTSRARFLYNLNAVTVTNSSSTAAGATSIGSAFNLASFIQMYDDSTDANVSAVIYNEPFLDLLGLSAGGGGIGFGPGGGTGVSNYIFYNASNEFKTNANILTTQTASAGGHLMSRDASDARYPRSLFDHFADAGNTTTSETDLYSDTIAASQLGTNGDMLEARYSGKYVSAVTKDIRVKFAGSTLLDTGALTITTGNWSVEGWIIRVSATVVRWKFTYNSDSSTAADRSVTKQGELTGLTLSNTNILKITGQAGAGGATNDIVAQSGKVRFQPHV